MANTIEVREENDNASAKEKTVELVEGTGINDDTLDLADRERERRVKWKIDLLILPLLSTVYFLASMGRSDLGNAKIAGMDKELNLTPKQYSNVGSIFFVGYIVLQLPATLLVRKIGPPYQFGAAMMAWGTITACTVVIHSYAELMVIRTFVGVTEAFVQGAVFYLSFWYPYNELATRGAIFFSMSTVAGAFNGLIAYAVQTTLDGKSGWRAWKWLFLIEGIIPIGWAFVVIFFLPNTPETVKFGFTEEEKLLLVKRSRRARNTGEAKILPQKIIKVILDYKFWMSVGIECATVSSVNAVGNFLPDILHSFGWSTVKSQLMSVIVYAVAFVGIIFWARVSDKWGRRGYVIIINCMTAVIGYILLLTLTNNSGRFFSTCLVAMGLFSNVVVNLTWVASINIGYTYRASAAALINSIAQAVAIGVNQAYDDPPLYRKGNGTALGLVGLACLLATSLVLALKWENKKKREQQNGEEAARLRGFSIDEIGNRHPDYFFMY